jgi:hypothetical protein
VVSEYKHVLLLSWNRLSDSCGVMIHGSAGEEDQPRLTSADCRGAQAFAALAGCVEECREENGAWNFDR